MSKKTLGLVIAILVVVAALASVGAIGWVLPARAQLAPTPTPTTPGTVVVPSNASEVLAALETTLEQLYIQVNPSVVNIQVVQQVSGAILPDIPGFPYGQNIPQVPHQTQGQGSGFVWDTQGNIVTNDHVVDGATNIQVTFYDGTSSPATLVGADPYSDLAVVKVEVPAGQLHPVEVADSGQVKVGELCVAIGNPFGLNGTMTVGFVSAVGRSLSAQSAAEQGARYTIPDVIQTDAPINPGNSGGVLVNDAGQLIGVTSAIESSGGDNSGIGFAIPSAIVRKVVPALIETGHYDHPWLGVSGTSLTRDLAQAMGLDPNQRGALVISTIPDGPAAKAGLKGSDRRETINGQQVQIGGDVIVAIEGTPIQGFDALVSYLANNAAVGQTVTLTVLRQGKEVTLRATLGTRPIEAPPSARPQIPGRGAAYLGIVGRTMTPAIARSMDLPRDQQGVLVEQVQPDSGAERAGLRAGDRTMTIDGQSVRVGGDVITAMDGRPVTGMEVLRSLLGELQPGDQAKLTLLRGGESVEVDVTLAAYPGSMPE